VTDFGLSVVKGGVSHENMMMDFCGTPMYMGKLRLYSFVTIDILSISAPEIIDNKSYSEKCDVWAMGVMMHML
jgi:serine/threonine kinase 33